MAASHSWDTDRLRQAFTSYFTERGHTAVASSGLIPHHRSAPMFTNAGMNQFVPYFLGEEAAPYRRATSVQKCVRLSGKHNDVDEIGKTRRHLTFFEMVGNFSFGDYFKAEAIPMAWELLTEVVGFDGDRLWITVHDSDDEAEAIWHDVAGVPMERIQRLDKDNFWEMGETGPCGPCSEVHLDNGPEWGDGGGPAKGAGDRYVEFWNLVFMQYYRAADGTLTDLPDKNVDTGGGLERWLMLLQDVPTVFDTDQLRHLVDAVEAASGKRYGADPKHDIALRVVADHARTMAFLVSDGVTPSNEERGYVLRSVIRRAVRRGYTLGIEQPFLAALVGEVTARMGAAYPDLARNADTVAAVVEREEARFRQTLAAGTALLEAELDKGTVSGEVAFRLHDTYGFPIEITEEVAEERGVGIDRAGFDTAMAEQRRRGKDARKTGTAEDGDLARYRDLVDAHGRTEFTGYEEYESKATVLAVLGDEVFLDRTPFYAEGGGQVGDTGVIESETGTLRVLDTTYALPGLHRHNVEVTSGEVTAGQAVLAKVDAERRDGIRRNHTGTHLLHWALREVLGPHVKQAGSLVEADRLRFDFSHFEGVTAAQLRHVEELANERVLGNEPVRAYETSKDHAEQLGAIAFFGDKYGDTVRIVEAGERSMELCGGTHVDALGFIGPVKIVSEGSIGSNLRRIEAVTGAASLARILEEEDLLARAATLLKVKPDELPERIERALEEQKTLQREIDALRRALAGGEGQTLSAEAVDGVVVARRDGLTRDELRDLALAVRDADGIKGVVLGGEPPGGGVALIAAVRQGSGLHASTLIADAARTVGGGGGKSADIAMAGGRDAARLDEALEQARAAAAAGAA